MSRVSFIHTCLHNSATQGTWMNECVPISHAAARPDPFFISFFFFQHDGRAPPISDNNAEHTTRRRTQTTGRSLEERSNTAPSLPPSLPHTHTHTHTSCDTRPNDRKKKKGYIALPRWEKKKVRRATCDRKPVQFPLNKRGWCWRNHKKKRRGNEFYIILQ